MNDARLLETVRDLFRLSTAQLSGILDVGDRRLRRILAGEEALPGSARLLLQLLAARPDLMPIVNRLRHGLPLEDEPNEYERDAQSPSTSFRP